MTHEEVYIIKAFLWLLRKSREEGEDISLMDLVSESPYKDFYLNNFRNFLDLPPRIFFARIMKHERWSSYFMKVAEIFYEELLNE